MATRNLVIYLHGFRSSPQSLKARLIAQRMEELGRAADYFCPQLSASPAEAVRQVMQLIKRERVDVNADVNAVATAGAAADAAASNVTLIGSSLGGYYATWIAEQTGCKAVLLNPAVQPPRDLARYVGVSTAWHSGEHFEFKAEYVAELTALAIDRISAPHRYFLIAATGDEVLDWHEMAAHYPGAQQRIVEGSDHGLSDFADYLDAVLAWCGASLPQAPDAASTGLAESCKQAGA
jgi:predicted esterase YcpF (UPF0227 family)